MTILIKLLIICIALFPKINIISVGNSSAGIRIEDFLLALICIILFIYSNRNDEYKNSDKQLSEVKKFFYLYFVFSIISTFYGILRGYISPIVSVLFVIRKLEYFFMLYIGYYFGMKNIKCSKNIFDIIVLFHFIISILQLSGIIGSFNRGEMISSLTQGRVSSTFNGAYELSAFLLLILPYYLFMLFDNKSKKLKPILFIIIISFEIIISMSRTSLIIEILLLILLIFKQKLLKNRKIVQKLFICFAILLFPICYIIIPKIDLSRFENLNYKKTIDIFKYTWKYKNFNKYIATGSWYGDSIYSLNQFASMGYDGSLYQRVSHWMQLIDGWMNSPIIGIGVSVSGNSADGNYIKILVETGIIGLLLWIFLLKKIYGILSEEKNWLIYSYISVLLGALFIDLFDSSKVIMSLWFLIGVYMRRSFDSDEENIKKYCFNK